VTYNDKTRSQHLKQGCTTYSLFPVTLRLILLITATSEFKIFDSFALLMFCVYALSLACFHMSVWLSY